MGFLVHPYWLSGVSDNETSSPVTNRAMERALGRNEDCRNCINCVVCTPLVLSHNIFLICQTQF
jgi:hypothetical protein